MRTLEHIYLDTDAWTDTGTESNANYSAAQTALENLERTLNSLDDLLSEFGSISRPNQDEHLEKLSRALEAMKHCRQELSGDIEEYIDRPLKRSFNELNDILASIDEREITTPNDLGLDAEKYYFDDLGERHSFRQELKEITMADLMGTHTGPFGTAYDQKIEQFTEVLERDYNYRVLKRNVKTEIDKDAEYTYNDYVKEFYTISETVFVKDMTTAEKMRNAIWRATGAGYIIDGVMGYSLINGDRLTDGERDSRVSEGTLTTAFTLLPGVATLGSGEGVAEALLATAKCFEYNALWNAAPDAADEAGIRDLGFVLRLCMALGAAYETGKVGYVEGKAAGESSETVSSFSELMSPEESERYLKFLENGSTQGLTQAETEGIKKVDELLVLKKVNYQEVLDIRNSGNVLESGSKTGVKGDTGTLKPDELIVRDSKFLDADGNIDWDTWAPNGGRVPGTIQEGQTLDVGTIIDRYGNPYGKYTSPIGVPYEQRALPYVENPNAYHKYEVLKPIDNVTISQIAEALEQPGGGMQYELPSIVNKLIKDKFLREIE